ncbi:MAG TPA: META domain-containing protein [Anaerolineaceae bacterium]|nr:META domain-containing protein [Anaerolineaceae bacterium]
MTQSRHWPFILVILLALLAACTPAGETAAIPEPLLGSRWVLDDLAGQPLVPDTHITLIFDPEPAGTAGGSAGCNSYGGAVAASGEEHLRFGEIAQTAMACVDKAGNTLNAVMEQEAAYLEALNAVRYYQIEDDRLTLFGEDRQPLLAYTRQVVYQNDPAALAGTAWRLERWDGEPVDPQTPLTIRFDTGRASGLAGCRSYTAETEVSASEIRFLATSMDEAACAGSLPVTELEGDFTSLMDAAWSYHLLADRLEVVTGRGVELIFVPLGAEEPAVETTTWTLVAFVENGVETPALAGSEITLAFEGNVLAEEGKLAGSAGCNHYSARYQASGSGLTVQPPVSTKMFCAEPAGVMDQETRFLQALMDVTAYALTTDNRLTLSTADGRSLVFAGEE